MATPRILIVDDEPHIVQVVRLKLQNAGYDVITAGDGEEAFELAREAPPDLVITDFQMPYMTGLDLCRALARDPRTARVPVVMLTARGYALDDEDLEIGNIRDVQSKPFSPRAILQRVEQILAQPRADAGGNSEAISEAA